MRRAVALGLLAVAVGLLSVDAREVSADTSAQAENGGTFTTTSLYSPTAPSGAPVGRAVSLSWTPSSPQNGNGYVLSGVNIGSNPTTPCPVGAAAYAFVGGAAGAGFTDATALAGGTQGTYACYLVRSAYAASAPSSWSVDPGWVSADALPTAKTAIGFFASSLTFTNGGAAGRLDTGDTIVITFDQPVAPASIGTISFLCASVSSGTIYLGVTGGVTICPTATTVGSLAGMTLFNAQNADGRYAATGAWSSGSAKLTITIGALSAGWRRVRIAAGTETLTPAGTITSATGAAAICATAVCRPTTTTRP
jgi:hypothetical protein